MNILFRRVFIVCTLFFYNSNNAQISNKIEGIFFNVPCEVDYIRNLQNQNNYNCPHLDNKGFIHDYSMTVSNLFDDLNGLSANELTVYKKEYLKTIKEDSIRDGAISSEDFEFSNGTKALLTVSSLDYLGSKFIVYSIYFIYRKKHFAVNHATNDINNDFLKNNLMKRISFN